MREFQDGDFPFANEMNALLRDSPDGTYIDTGCSVGDGGTDDMTVDVTSGGARINNSAVSVGAQSVTLDAASSFKRYDLIVVGSDGVAEKVTGNTEKVAPAIPADHALLATIEVPANASGVTNSNIFDGRVLGFAASLLDGKNANEIEATTGEMALWYAGI